MAAKNSFKRRLQRELTANPKKTAMLGLLFLVAIWFWAPLVAKWLGKEPGGESVAQTSSEPATQPTSAANSANPATTAAAQQKTPKWSAMVESIENDRLMKPHMPQTGSRDPFSPSNSRLSAQKKSEEHLAQQTVPETTPEQAGIVLRSTVVGTRSKTALINNRAYHEGQSVPATGGQEPFTVVKIRADGVVFSRHGRQFQMKLPKLESAVVEE
jgi:hypothetical protein